MTLSDDFSTNRHVVDSSTWLVPFTMGSTASGASIAAGVAAPDALNSAWTTASGDPSRQSLMP